MPSIQDLMKSRHLLYQVMVEKTLLFLEIPIISGSLFSKKVVA